MDTALLSYINSLIFTLSKEIYIHYSINAIYVQTIFLFK